MDQKTFKELSKKLKEVNSVIKVLDPAMRTEAFTILRPYISTGSPAGKSKSGTSDISTNTTSLEWLVELGSDKPAENALAIAAHLYRQYGSESFYGKEVKEIAEQAGIVIPDRVDNTFRMAKRDGKPLFRQPAKGTFKPTVHGEKFMKATFNVKKGTKRRESDK